MTDSAIETGAIDTNWMFGDAEIITTRTLDEPRKHKRTVKHRKDRAMLKREIFAEFFTELPAPGESIHLVSNGKYDYFSSIPIITQLLGGKGIEFYGSTWTMNRINVRDLFALFDSGAITRIGMMSGTYFAKRETSVYAMLVEGLQKRNQRFVAFANHSKVSLLSNGTDFISAEGSANYTSNPRLENLVVTNDEPLYRFHQSWMEHFLS